MNNQSLREGFRESVIPADFSAETEHPFFPGHVIIQLSNPDDINSEVGSPIIVGAQTDGVIQGRQLTVDGKTITCEETTHPIDRDADYSVIGTLSTEPLYHLPGDPYRTGTLLRSTSDPTHAVLITSAMEHDGKTLHYAAHSVEVDPDCLKVTPELEILLPDDEFEVIGKFDPLSPAFASLFEKNNSTVEGIVVEVRH